MSTVSPGSNIPVIPKETGSPLDVATEEFKNDHRQNSDETLVNAVAAMRDTAVIVAGEQPHKASDGTAPATLPDTAATIVPDVDMAEFFSIDNLEISKDKDGTTIVDGVPVGDTPLEHSTAKFNDLSTPIKQRAKSETLESTIVQKPHLQSHAKSVPHSPLAKPLQINQTSILQAITDPTNKSTSTSEAPRVSAYARLDFHKFTFYVQTLQVILGRRPENGDSMVDVDLGVAKAISRRHAKIFYNFGTQRFELNVLGRNGAFVDDNFVDKGSTVPLKNK